MKKLLILTSGLLFSSCLSATASESNGDNGNPPSSPPPQKTIWLNKSGKRQGHPTKSRRIEGFLQVVDETLYMVLPLTTYPLQVEIGDESGFSGYWNSIFIDPNSCSMFFDGGVGTYEVTITDSEDSVFVGYFTID